MTASDHTAPFGARLMRNAGAWLIGTALVFIALGIAAIVEPFVAGLAMSLLVGWLLVAAGITHVLSVFRRDDGGTIWHLAVGLFYVCGGWYFLSNPVIALGALTLLLAMMLFVEAGVDLVAYSAQREEPGAAWLLVNATVTAILGILIAMGWPSTSVWAIGTIVGINLLTTGISRLMLGTSMRTVERRMAA